MWKYYLFRIIGTPLSLLPMWAGYIVAYIVADTVYALMPGLRSAVADNVRHVLGQEADDAAVRRAVRGVIRNAAKNYFDLIKMPRIGLSGIEKRITVHGWDHFEEALGRGRGVILVSAHLGSFDLTGQILAARSVKTTILVEAQEPQALLDYVTALRGGKGLTFVPARPGAVRTMVRAVRRGETVGLMCDRDIAREGLALAFFGEELTMPTEAVRLSMRTGAAIVPVYNARRAQGGYDVFFEPALPMTTDGDNARARNMACLAGTLERFIRACPDQWVVLSAVWEEGYRRRAAQGGRRLVPSGTSPGTSQ